MEQATQNTVDPKVRSVIRTLKASIKTMSEDLKQLKRCRKTKKENLHPDRDAIFAKHSISDPSWQLPSRIDSLKHEVTTALMLYGDLRGKPHTVREPQRYTRAQMRLMDHYEL